MSARSCGVERVERARLVPFVILSVLIGLLTLIMLRDLIVVTNVIMLRDPIVVTNVTVLRDLIVVTNVTVLRDFVLHEIEASPARRRNAARASARRQANGVEGGAHASPGAEWP